jgi:hypothetical protein
MKTLFSLIAFSISFAFGQNVISISQAEYHNLKQAGLIDQSAKYIFSDLAFPSNIKYAGSVEKNGVCDCMIPLDSTFLLAMLPNDDNSSELINLPFTFDFYGNQYNSLYINNNGNISFVSPYITWTSNTFPDSSYNMIAPFWGDVDTRGDMDSLGNFVGNGGNVWYKITPTAFIVNWNQVGYFNMHSDLVSTFQLIITNGSDSLISAGGNVSFCYQDMQWTTGDASFGSAGFGGSPATVGVNVGNGIDYFQVGQFDQAGTSFDGPVNNNDGIDFLDGQEIYFNVAGMTTTNTPPLLISSAICDTIDVFTGDTLQKSLNSIGFEIGLLTPEIQQSISISFDSDAPANAFSYNLSSQDNQFYGIEAIFDATGISPGIYTVNLTATDDGTPVGITSKQFIFNVKYDASLGLTNVTENEFNVYPNPTYDRISIVLNEEKGINRMRLQDLYGKTILEKEIVNKEQLDLSNLKEGIYMLTIFSNNEIIGNKRVLKK